MIPPQRSYDQRHQRLRGLTETVNSASSRRANARLLPAQSAILIALAVYGFALPVFLIQALPIYSSVDRILAWILFVVGTVPLIRATVQPTGVPLIHFVAGQYVLFFSLPVFFEQNMHLQLSGWVVPASGAITVALVCALLALISIGVGYRLCGRIFNLRFKFLLFQPNLERLFWYGAAIVVGSFLLQLEVLALFGVARSAGIARPLELVFSTDLGLAILACLYHAGRLSAWKRPFVITLVVIAVVIGFAGGMIQNAAEPVVIWLVCGWVIRRKAPVIWLAVIAAVFFALQPVKGTYRSILRLSPQPLSTIRKVELYSGLVENYWTGKGGRTAQIMNRNRESASNRLSLLLTTAHYIEWTPYPIPYKNGVTLAYLGYTWIPRAVWPEKPIAQVANKILPVEYDIQTAANTETTMFGVGHLAEAYVNFGVIGIVPVFLLLGCLYRIPNLLLERRTTPATMAIYVALTVAMFPIGSSIGDAFGGFVQQILLQGVLLRFFTASRRKVHERPQMPVYRVADATPRLSRGARPGAVAVSPMDEGSR